VCPEITQRRAIWLRFRPLERRRKMARLDLYGLLTRRAGSRHCQISGKRSCVCRYIRTTFIDHAVTRLSTATLRKLSPLGCVQAFEETCPSGHGCICQLRCARKAMAFERLLLSVRRVDSFASDGRALWRAPRHLPWPPRMASDRSVSALAIAQ